MMDSYHANVITAYACVPMACISLLLGIMCASDAIGGFFFFLAGVSAVTAIGAFIVASYLAAPR